MSGTDLIGTAARNIQVSEIYVAGVVDQCFRAALITAHDRGARTGSVTQVFFVIDL